MQHYQVIDGKYVLHELNQDLRPRLVRPIEAKGMSDQEAARRGLLVMHDQVAVAYYLGVNRVATHGSPEGMAVWCTAHNAHSPHKVAAITLPKGHPVDAVNALIHDDDELRKLVGPPSA